jgi:hypothetical protein
MNGQTPLANDFLRIPDACPRARRRTRTPPGGWARPGPGPGGHRGFRGAGFRFRRARATQVSLRAAEWPAFDKLTAINPTAVTERRGSRRAGRRNSTDRCDSLASPRLRAAAGPGIGLEETAVSASDTDMNPGRRPATPLPGGAATARGSTPLSQAGGVRSLSQPRRGRSILMPPYPEPPSRSCRAWASPGPAAHDTAKERSATKCAATRGSGGTRQRHFPEDVRAVWSSSSM